MHTDWFPSPLASGQQLGFGFVTGALLGWAAKKIAKLLLVLLAIFVFLLQLLAYKGFITIHWAQITPSLDLSHLTVPQQFLHIATYNLPFGGAFIAGFVLGFKHG